MAKIAAQHAAAWAELAEALSEDMPRKLLWVTCDSTTRRNALLAQFEAAFPAFQHFSCAGAGYFDDWVYQGIQNFFELQVAIQDAVDPSKPIILHVTAMESYLSIIEMYALGRAFHRSMKDAILELPNKLAFRLVFWSGSQWTSSPYYPQFSGWIEHLHRIHFSCEDIRYRESRGYPSTAPPTEPIAEKKLGDHLRKLLHLASLTPTPEDLWPSLVLAYDRIGAHAHSIHYQLLLLDLISPNQVRERVERLLHIGRRYLQMGKIPIAVPFFEECLALAKVSYYDHPIDTNIVWGKVEHLPDSYQRYNLLHCGKDYHILCYTGYYNTVFGDESKILGTQLLLDGYPLACMEILRRGVDYSLSDGEYEVANEILLELAMWYLVLDRMEECVCALVEGYHAEIGSDVFVPLFKYALTRVDPDRKADIVDGLIDRGFRLGLAKIDISDDRDNWRKFL